MQTGEEFQALKLLRSAQQRLSREEVADSLGYSVRSIERWENGQMPSPKLVIHALTNVLRELPAHSTRAPGEFTFVDLFAGIGGTRIGWESAGGECVFTCEYDKYCQLTYRQNFRPQHEIVSDIRSITDASRQVPDHDVLLAGFPCQPFSIAGVSKKNALGRAHGFECETQGTLFFDICRIIAAKRPAAFMLENVRNLRSHDGGRTFEVIRRSLVDLGYQVEYTIIDAQAFVPQHRERVFIAGFREPTAFSFENVKLPKRPGPKLGAILHPEDGSETADGEFTVGAKARVNPKYGLTDHLWTYLQNYAKKHQAAGNGFGFGLVTPRNIARTLSARYYKDGSEILVSRGKKKTPRRLTPRECARLMGFPDDYKIPVSDTQAYKQFGNSVVVPVIEAVAAAMRPHVIAVKQQAGSLQQSFAA
jgi:DNA (cytosine-5)-methyltransferase 1